jgi:serine phosphatase RsbU (regulator of sigma subunit)
MAERVLQTISQKLRPELAGMDETGRQHSQIEVMAILFTGPFALLTLAWLAAVTDLDVIADHWLMLALLAGVLALIQQHLFTILVQLRSGDLVPITGSLGGIVSWSAALIFGPVALWLAVMVRFLAAIQMAWRVSRFQQKPFWPVLSLLSQEIGGEVFGGVVGLAVYTAAGGAYPLSGLHASEWSAIPASLVQALLPNLVALPLIVYVSRLGEGGMLRSWVIIFMFGLVMVNPFSILGALIYSEANAGLFLFFVAGVVLVNELVYYLSQTNQRSQQRARELAHLEALGEALIQAPPDPSALPDLLAAHVEGMFPRDRIEVRLFQPRAGLPPGLRWPTYTLTVPPDSAPVDEAVWTRLHEVPGDHLVLHHVIPPGMRHAYGDALLAKIMADAPGLEGGEKEWLLGGICLLRRTAMGKPTQSLAAVQSLASQIGSAFYRAQVNLETLAAHKMAQELELAGRIQARFLPRRVPDVPGWDIAAGLDPARQTSGDFYDFIPLDGGCLGLVVADVADKGTGAALFMALSRTLIRTFALQHPTAPDETLRAANERLLIDAESDQFVTVFYGVLDPQSGVLTYANAGHNPACVLHARSGGAVAMLGKTGVPLGLFEGMRWTQGTTTVAPGDVLLLYTDGVSEAQNERREEFGLTRLLDAARANLGRSAQDVHAAIMRAVADFVGDAPQFDDLTLVVAVRQAASGQETG